MRNQRRLIFAALLLGIPIALIGLIWAVSGPPDPVYQGKHLHEWIATFDPTKGGDCPEARALQHYGSNAAPLLIHMLERRESKPQATLRDLLSRQSFIHFNFVPAEVTHRQALHACSLLGPEVRATTPALTALANDITQANSITLAGWFSYNPLDNARYATDVLTQMGPDGISALVQLLQSRHPGARVRAAQLLATAPGTGTAEVIAALKANVKQLSANTNWRAFSLDEAGQSEPKPVSPLKFGTAGWATAPEAPLDQPPSLWDIKRGVRVVSTSGLFPGFKAEDAFGSRLSSTGTGETGSVVFQDSMPDGSVHFIEWETPAPVTVSSFGLVAGHDAAVSSFQRAFRTFRLSARSEESGEYKFVYAQDFPVPYGEGSFSARLFLFRNLEAPVAARRFRAEFVQNGTGNWNGPRVIRLYGFGQPLNLPMVMSGLQDQSAEIQADIGRLLEKEKRNR